MQRDDQLQDDVVTLAELLQEQGYYTVAFVANTNISSTFGFEQGFQEFHELLEAVPETVFVSSAGVNEKIFEFLERYPSARNRKPLFLLVWTVDPHDPYAPPGELKHLFNIEQYTPTDAYHVTKLRGSKTQLTESQLNYIKTLYDQEIYLTDTSFGNLLQKLQVLDLYEDAVILFTSDHGEEFFEHGGFGHGLTLYNEQVKIPFILKAPQPLQSSYEERVQLTDIFPTLLDILGIAPPYQLDGISLLASIKADRVLYLEEELDGNDLTARVDDTGKVIFNKSFNRPPSPLYVPFFEFYAREDEREQHNLPRTGMDDQLRIQELLSYRDREGFLGLQQVEVEVSPELDQQLRDLGYIK